MNREKLDLESLTDLADYSLNYSPFREEIGDNKFTIKQFGQELAKEMCYHRMLDKEQGIQ